MRVGGFPAAKVSFCFSHPSGLLVALSPSCLIRTEAKPPHHSEAPHMEAKAGVRGWKGNDWAETASSSSQPCLPETGHPHPSTPTALSADFRSSSPRPPWSPPLTGSDVQTHRVAGAGLARLTPVVPAVVDLGLKAEVGPDLGRDGGPVTGPLGGAVPRAVGPLAVQSHVVLPQHVEPGGLQAHHGLRETC